VAMISSSKKGLSPGAGAFLALLFCLSAPTILSPELPYASVYAQTPAKVRSIPIDFVTEGGCPVAPSTMRCELDVDPFDAPMDARVYLDYRNNSDRPLSAVKFRLRFVDAEGRDRGTFHVVDPYPVSPQAGHGVKAKRDFTLHPAVVALKVRVLQVKYGDGSDWSSEKMKELARPASAGGGAPAMSEDGGGMAEPAVPAAAAPAYAPAAPAAPAYAPAAPAYSPTAPAQAQAPQQFVQTGVRGKSYEVAPADAALNYTPPATSAVPPAAAAPAPAQAQAPVQAAPPPPPAAPAQAQAPAQAAAPPPAATAAAPPASVPPSSAAPPIDYSKFKYKGPEPVNKPYSPLDDEPAGGAAKAAPAVAPPAADTK
jgi:hypothetical protein